EILDQNNQPLKGSSTRLTRFRVFMTSWVEMAEERSQPVLALLIPLVWGPLIVLLVTLIG
ncbi:hypothetical protein, partial [uncultured Planktomarina sp.]|uniref:hypothetical protein n=1 Tax=uncultured Planktomarina sp. TaxID=1538529 RepID=UPI003260D01D